MSAPGAALAFPPMAKPRAAAWLIGIYFQRLADFDGAEAAVAGADVTQDHKGGGSFRPTFAQVGAGGRSFGSPRRLPPAAHRSNNAICASVSRRTPAKSP